MGSWVDDVKGINNKVRQEILINQKVEFDELKNMSIEEIKLALKIQDTKHLRAIYDYLKNFTS